MNRKCGSCTLCCKLLPVAEINKGAGQRCQYQGHKGCAVYHRPPHFPRSCAAWSCRWLIDPETKGLHDQMPDIVQLTDNDSGETRELLVLQVWVDPARRDAWQEPHLLGYAEQLARDHHMGMLIRYSSAEAIAVLPPALSADRQWRTISDGRIAESVTGSLLLDRLTETAG
jgi:hypothetical protein